MDLSDCPEVTPEMFVVLCACLLI